MKKITTKLMALLLGGSMLLSTGCDFMSSVTGLFGESASTDEHIHSFAVKKVAEEYLKSNATCENSAEYYYSCECGEKGEKTYFSGSKLSHDYSAEVVSAEYLKTPATCQSGAEYYKSCVSCGKKGYSFNTFVVDGYGDHSFMEQNASGLYIKEEATFDSPAEYYMSCKCGAIGEETFFYGEPLKVLTDEEKEAYRPMTLTMSFYDTENCVYGFTYNTMAKPLRPVLRIAEGGALGDSYQEYPASIEEMTSMNAGNMSMNYYICKVEVPLEAMRQYTYQVCDKYAEVSTDAVTFVAKDFTSEKFSFAHVSDTQVSGTSTGAYFERILEELNTDFMIHTGDLVQTGKYEYEWQDMLHDNAQYVAKLPIMAISGNHEGDYSGYEGSYELEKHFNYKTPSGDYGEKGQYYSFTYGNAKFIMLNANTRSSNNQLTKEQYEWLERELKDDTHTWKIVSMHQPMYSAGKWGSDSAYNATSLALKKQLCALFAENDVDLVLQGHDHVVSRTFPINVAGSPNAETWSEIDGIDYSVNPDGVIYVMNGCGGNQTRAPHADAKAELYKYKLTSNASSYAEISIDGNKLTVTVKYNTGSGAKTYNGCTWGIQKTNVA